MLIIITTCSKIQVRCPRCPRSRRPSFAVMTKGENKKMLAIYFLHEAITQSSLFGGPSAFLLRFWTPSKEKGKFTEVLLEYPSPSRQHGFLLPEGVIKTWHRTASLPLVGALVVCYPAIFLPAHWNGGLHAFPCQARRPRLDPPPVALQSPRRASMVII
jgi:hypothetical protein